MLCDPCNSILHLFTSVVALPHNFGWYRTTIQIGHGSYYSVLTYPLWLLLFLQTNAKSQAKSALKSADCCWCCKCIQVGCGATPRDAQRISPSTRSQCRCLCINYTPQIWCNSYQFISFMILLLPPPSSWQKLINSLYWPHSAKYNLLQNCTYTMLDILSILSLIHIWRCRRRG